MISVDDNDNKNDNDDNDDSDDNDNDNVNDNNYCTLCRCHRYHLLWVLKWSYISYV